MKGLIAIASMLTMISIGANADTQMYGNLAVGDHHNQNQPFVETTGSIGGSAGEHALNSPIQDQKPTPVGDHFGHHNGFSLDGTYR
jgi:hypothetical protein